MEESEREIEREKGRGRETETERERVREIDWVRESYLNVHFIPWYCSKHSQLKSFNVQYEKVHRRIIQGFQDGVHWKTLGLGTILDILGLRC